MTWCMGAPCTNECDNTSSLCVHDGVILTSRYILVFQRCFITMAILSRIAFWIQSNLSLHFCAFPLVLGNMTFSFKSALGVIDRNRAQPFADNHPIQNSIAIIRSSQHGMCMWIQNILPKCGVTSIPRHRQVRSQDAAFLGTCVRTYIAL